MEYERNARVIHQRLGPGTVVMDEGETVIVRFQDSIEECRKRDLALTEKPGSQVDWDPPHEVVARSLAYLIESINDSWGVFSRSRIELLPHQLWVCHLAIRSWPMRWMIADDVGLGKTIEAGLILWPLLSKKRVRRLLILCPASLVEQWQYRLRTMFDIRLTTYTSELDTPRSDYWNTHPMVVASVHTLRGDHNGRHERLLDSEAWDLVVVDEAHHLNNEEQTGATLAYQLLRKLEDHGKIESLLFFTGTPHKGKDYNFVSLLHLLRPDLVPNVKRTLEQILPDLPQMLIRNNKYSVTDLEGRRLFRPPHVVNETYAYTQEEERFYGAMTEFIASGKAYASSMSAADSRTAQLVLIAFQKLASSSIAAVRRALGRRLARIEAGQRELRAEGDRLERLRNDPYATEDEQREIEEEIAELATWVRLVADEPRWLRALLQHADEVDQETKIEEILRLVRTRFEGRSILFFTEYKATQSLLLSRLAVEYGDDQIVFINGDGRADDVGGTSIRLDRHTAAERFNSGAVRFLVSTEAAGEGIDLQENCHTLIHVDLPWNPTRLQQRVGRVNRFGQKHRVEVVAFRNPDTVESRIWEKLNEKIERIQQALVGSMDEPEDLLQLVLGMTSPDMFTRLFSEGSQVPKESLSSWFDQETARFGGRDAVEAVNALVGHASHFDYRSAARQIPKLDLPDLQPFFHLMLTHNHRRTSKGMGGISFITPDPWRDHIAIRSRYDEVTFDRGSGRAEASNDVLGIGHPLMTMAMEQALRLDARHALLPDDVLEHALLLFRFQNRVTTEESAVSTVVRGLEVTGSSIVPLSDAATFLRLKPLATAKLKPGVEAFRPATIESTVRVAEEWIAEHLTDMKVPFDLPFVACEAGFWPASNGPEDACPFVEMVDSVGGHGE